METIELIILYVSVSSIAMVLYFNHLAAKEKQEIKSITDANRIKASASIKQKAEQARKTEFAEAV